MTSVVQRLRELSGKGTPAGWGYETRARIHVTTDDANVAIMCDGGQTFESMQANGELICAMRNHLDALLDVAEALTEIVALLDDDEYPIPNYALLAALARLDPPAVEP